jgi:predicted negative regulator of RcsB-dependent stress response
MANHLDLEEQEQLDELKHFWKQYGNAITWLLIVVLGAVAAWNGYQYWQRSQASQAAAMYDEVGKVAASGDPEKAARAFGDMRDRFGSSTYTSQAGLMIAKSLYESGKLDEAKSTLKWVAEKSSDQGYAAIAKLRLSGLLMDEKAYDEALKAVDGVSSEQFAGLVSDRRADIFMAQGKKAEAKAEYLKAYKAMDSRTEYRRLVEVKLNALGVNPAADEVSK